MWPAYAGLPTPDTAPAASKAAAGLRYPRLSVFGGSGLRIARIGGFDVRLDPTWFIMALILASQSWSLAPGDSGRAARLAALTVGIFFGSVFAHEIAHAVAFRAFGIRVQHVTLWLMGGFTQPAEEASSPLAELLISAAGPAISAVVGLALLVAAGTDASGIVPAWGRLNLWLAALNALPGFPLDGGHMLRAIAWRLTGKRDTATLFAARVGQGLGALLVSAIALRNVSFGLFAPRGIALIGFFMIVVATAAARDVERTRRLQAVSARDVMTTPPPSIPGDMPVSEAIRTYLQGHDGEAFPVISEGRVVGLVSLGTASTFAGDRPVALASVPSDRVVQVAPEDRMANIVTRLHAGAAPTVLVVADGKLVGVIEPADLARLLSRRGR